MSSDAQTFHPIKNPYVVGNPIKDEKLFFGGKDNFEYIRDKVGKGSDGGLLVLCGPRRCGKTSTLYQILNGRLGDQYFPVMIDMQVMTDMTVESTTDFLKKLGEHIVDALVSGGAAESAAPGKHATFEDYLEKDRGSNPVDVFDKFMRDVTSGLGDKTLLLLFDEYEYFEQFIDNETISKEVFRYFSHWIENRRVFIIFAGSDEIEQRKDYWSGLLRRTPHYRRVEFLAREDTVALVTRPLRDVVHYEAGVPEKIYELTAGQPFYTQDICQDLIDDLNRIGSYDVTNEQLERIVEAGIRNPKPDMIFSWNRLEPIAKLALSIVGELNRDGVTPVKAADVRRFHRKQKLGFRMRRNSLNEALEKLFHRQILEQEEHGTFTFKMDLWRRWVARMHSIWQVLDETAGQTEPPQAWWIRGAAIAGVATIAIVAVGFSTDLFSGFTGSSSGGGSRSVRRDSAMVTITSVPPNADVWSGNELMGQTPIDSKKWPTGDYAIRVQLPGYKTREDSLTLVADEPFVGQYMLIQRTGGLHVTSQPSGAAILLDGERTGQSTPYTFPELPAGKEYAVTVAKTGYVSRTYRKQVVEDEVVSLEGDLTVARVRATIRTDPPGATVAVDGEVRSGVTPAVYTMDQGKRTITLTLTGYVTETRIHDAQRDDAVLSVTLSRQQPGTLHIVVIPYGDIYIDGKDAGKGEEVYENKHAVGTHTVRVEHPTLGVVEREVEIISGKTESISINMRTEGRQQ